MPSSRSRTRPGYFHLRILVVPLAALLGVCVARAPVVTAAAVLALVVLLCSITLPLRFLPVVALALYALVPVEWVPLPRVLATVSPPFMVIGIALLRGRLWRRPLPSPSPTWLALLGLTGWLSLNAALSDNLYTTVAWLLAFTVLVVGGFITTQQTPNTAGPLVLAWACIASALSVYALVEAFILNNNPLLADLYRQGAPGFVQEWGVYRSTATLGHPAHAALFLALGLPFTLELALLRDRRWLAAAGLCGGGVLSTGTRSALFAIMLALAWMLTCASLSGRLRDARVVTLPILASVLAMSLLALPLLGRVLMRSASAEAQASNETRSTGFQLALDVVPSSPVLGTGAGVASLTHEAQIQALGGAGSFESLWLELAVAAGLPGLALGVATVVSAHIRAIRARDWTMSAALIIYTVQATFFNLLEGGRVNLFVLGTLLGLTLARQPSVAGAAGLGGVSRLTVRASRHSPADTALDDPSARDYAGSSLVRDEQMAAKGQDEDST